MKKQEFRRMTRSMIKEAFDDASPEMMSRDKGYYDEPPDPQDSVDDFEGEHLRDLEDTVDQLISVVNSESGNWDKSYDKLVDLYQSLSNAINAVHDQAGRDKLQRKYQPILVKIYPLVSGGGNQRERFQEGRKSTMKKQLLEYIIRECVKEVLEAFPQEPETVGAPAPPAAGQGTADQPAIPQPEQPEQAAPPMAQTTQGVWYVDPKRPQKPVSLKLSSPRDPASLERELYRTAAKSGGPRVKVSSAALREVPKVLSAPNTALFLYIGKQNEDDPDDELYLLPARTLQQAQQSSIGAGVSAEHPTMPMPSDEPSMEMPQVRPQAAQKTMAPDIDENANLHNMLSSMIREALREAKK